ncbi:MAG: amidohydrolase family protein [Bacteroidia bacterium]|nr:amidohydrolase family protein [Bacteroidia bacterium]
MKKFYDIHMHVMDLSHANITAFAGRLIQDMDLDFQAWEKMGTFRYFLHYFWRRLKDKILHGFFRKKKPGPSHKEKLPEKLKKIRNLLSFMEGSIKYDFLVLDYFLKNKKELVSLNNELMIDGTIYNKIVLCPLIMDFGYRNIYGQNYFYNIPPQKPITEQINDVFESIRTYYSNELSINREVMPKKFVINKIDFNPDDKLFEIYPFMGLNPENYKYDDIEKMLKKYFSGFSANDTPERRKEILFNKMGKFKGDPDDEGDCANIFAGIKLYPPLGFNPWPCDCQPHEKKEMKHLDCEARQAKVELLYQWCVERNIPITTHCSNGGFVTDTRHIKLTNPGTGWAKVIEAYPGLKINFAHFGAGDEQWRETIVKHILRPGSNVYTDFSCSAMSNEYYKELEKTIKSSNNPGLLSERILFGSDFMINLVWTESYNQYLQYFTNTKHLISNKVKLCNENPERFLFG